MANSNSVVSVIKQWEKRMGFVTPLIWTNIIIISTVHLIPLFWLTVYFYMGWYPMWQTLAFCYFNNVIAVFGVTGGVNRYWCHRSYGAKMPLQILLAICYTIAGQSTIYHWVRDHRVHHKFSETSADPHDANRGLFFSHVGWLMMRKHPDVIREGSKIDMSDIANDPVVQFHTKFFTHLKLIFCVILPIVIPTLLWNESWDYSILMALIRYMLTLNFTWSINISRHMENNHNVRLLGYGTHFFGSS